MLKICSLASSSSGNCIYVGTDSTHILVDAGISCKRVKSGLESIDVDPGSIDAVLITHEHSDHIRGLGVLSRRYNIPVYATELTWHAALSSGTVGEIDRTLFRKIESDSDFAINELVIHPFKTSHDAADPVCYTFTKNKKKISIATDLGCYSSYISEKLKGSNVLFIEANHDIEMLKNGSYPFYLKKRILSDTGHLSNETSGRLLSELLNDNLQYVILGHLSKENNRPEIADQTVRSCLELSGCICGSDLKLIVSEKESISPLAVI